MGAAWQWFLYTMLPLPLTLLFLMTFPGAQWVRRTVLRSTASIMSTRVSLGSSSFRLVYAFVFVVSVVFLSGTATCLRLQNEKDIADESLMSPAQRMQVLARRWRADRNWWISLFALVMWYLLARVAALCTKLHRLEEAQKAEKAK